MGKPELTRSFHKGYPLVAVGPKSAFLGVDPLQSIVEVEHTVGKLTAAQAEL
jgi:hypothetical protein